MKYLFVILTLCGSAFATCSGGGTVWNCTAGTTPAQVNTMIGSATDGATATFANGAYALGGGAITPSLTKGITFACATVAGCTVSGSNTVFGFPVGVSSKLYRISGFDFTQTAGNVIYSCPGGSCAATTLSQIRVDHNTFRTSTSDLSFMFWGDNASSDLYYYGVIDHNTVLCTLACELAQFFNGDSPNAPIGGMGSINNMFVEDNSIVVTTLNNAGTGMVDGWGGAGVVVRHNTITNTRLLMHGVTHAWGPKNFEVYDNTGVFNSGASGTQIENCERFIHHQGAGTMMYFNNTCTPFTGAGHGTFPAVLHYRSTRNALQNRCNGTVNFTYGQFNLGDGNRAPTGTFLGYPCFRQPGRDMNMAFKPIYSWNNKYGDTNTISDLGCEEADTGVGNPTACGFHILANRDYYNGISLSAWTTPGTPLTTGMAFGTLVNRPTNCTSGAESPGGVGYFATDIGAQGALYTCSATNTWSTYYTPFTYPHPLVSAPGSPVASLSPSSFNFGTQNVGTSSGPQAFSLQNTGASIMNISSIAITGPVGSLDFSQTNTCGATLAVSASCTVNVVFTPSGPVSRTGSVTVTSDATNSPTNATVTGTGIIAFSSMNGVTIDGAVTVH